MVLIILVDGVPWAMPGGVRWFTTSREEADRKAAELREQFGGTRRVQVCPVPHHVAKGA